MKNLLIIIFFMLFSFKLYGVDCLRHKIYCSIIKLSPYIDKDFAMELSNEIFKYSNIYNIDPLRTVAIGMQENNFINKSVEILTIRREMICNDNTCETEEKFKKVYDIGLFQINELTAKKNNFDVNKLQIDWKYSVKCHFKILKNKIKMCSNLKEDAWSCYHSTNNKYRLEYMKKVNKYYDIINSE